MNIFLKKIAKYKFPNVGFTQHSKYFNYKTGDELSIAQNKNLKSAKYKLLSAGFTTLEIAISMMVFVLVILLVNSMYAISQRSYSKGSNKAELAQNARVVFDRTSRELRQSTNIITLLPPTGIDPLNPPPNEIFFQDGHNIDQITYLRYRLDGSNLMRQHSAYYFAGAPGIYVDYNSIDGFGNPPTELVLEDRIVGEYFNSLKFWGANGLIHISIKLLKNQDIVNFDTNVYSRNL